MKPIDFILLAIIALVLGLAIRQIWRNRKSGCNCGCGSPDCKNCKH